MNGAGGDVTLLQNLVEEVKMSREYALLGNYATAAVYFDTAQSTLQVSGCALTLQRCLVCLLVVESTPVAPWPSHVPSPRPTLPAELPSHMHRQAPHQVDATEGELDARGRAGPRARP